MRHVVHLLDMLLNEDGRRTPRRSRGPRRASEHAAREQQRPWSRTAPWL